MQTLISVFGNRADARKALDKLVAAGFSREHVQLHPRDDAQEPLAQEVKEEDRGVFDSIGHFFVSLFGEDRGEKAADPYRGSVDRGHTVVMVEAHDDHEAEVAAVVLHEQGAIDVDDRDSSGGEPVRRGVRVYAHPDANEDSPMAVRAGQVSEHL